MPSLNEKREAARGTTERNRAIVNMYIHAVPQAEISERTDVSLPRIHA